MKHYKYKREHFETQEQFDNFRKGRAKAQKKWLKKHELANPEYKERRVLRQRLYSRYYHSGYKESFAHWLKEVHQIDDMKHISLLALRQRVAKVKQL